MNKTSRKIALFNMLIHSLLSANIERSSSSKIDPDSICQALSIMSREMCQSYSDSKLEELRSQFEIAKKKYDDLKIPADLALLFGRYKTIKDFIASAKPKINEYKNYFRRQFESILNICYPKEFESKKEIDYLIKNIPSFILENNDPGIASLMNSFNLSIKDMSCSQKNAQKNKYAQNHLNILIDLTRGDPRVAALELPPVNEIKNKEEVIDQILDALAPELDQCDEDIENRLLADLIDFTRDDPRVAALRLPPLVQIKDKDKEQTIDRILDIVYDAYDNIKDFYNEFTSRIYLNSNNIFKLISLIRRNRRNAKKLHDYFILFRNYTDDEDKLGFLVLEYAKLFRKESFNHTFEVFDQFNNAKNDLKNSQEIVKKIAKIMLSSKSIKEYQGDKNTISIKSLDYSSKP